MLLVAAGECGEKEQSNLGTYNLRCIFFFLGLKSEAGERSPAARILNS